MNAEISETMGATIEIWRTDSWASYAAQDIEIWRTDSWASYAAQVFSVECHAHYNTHKPPKTVAPTVLMLDRRPQTAQNCGSYSFDARINITEMYCSHQYLSIDLKINWNVLFSSKPIDWPKKT